MRHSTRILLCRLGFLLFCVAPTASVGVWIVFRGTNGTAAQKAEWERELAGRLGLAVEIGRVGYPHPNLARLQDVRLLDPETRTPLAGAAMIDVSPLAAGWSLAAVDSFIEVRQLPRLAAALDSHLLRGPTSLTTAISLLPCEMTLRNPAADMTLRLPGGQFSASENGAKLAIELVLPGATAETQPAQWTVARDRTQSPPVTIWQFDTSGSAWPCGLVRDVVPAASLLGERCRFTGRFILVDSPGGQSGNLTGSFQEVDLDAAVSEQLPHQLSGLATLRIERAVLDGDKLAELRGTLQAQNGTISRSLVTAAQEHLQLDSAAVADENSAAPIPFRQLAIGFHLDGRALSLTGSADPTQDGMLAANAAGPILTAPARHSVPAVNVLRALLPDSEYQVPATRQTRALVNLLPMPNAASAGATRNAEHIPTRLAPASLSPQTAVRQPSLR